MPRCEPGAAQARRKVAGEPASGHRRVARADDGERPAAKQADIADRRQDRRLIGEGREGGRIGGLAENEEPAAAGRRCLFFASNSGFVYVSDLVAGGAR
jgi:hypothetical protein